MEHHPGEDDPGMGPGAGAAGRGGRLPGEGEGVLRRRAAGGMSPRRAPAAADRLTTLVHELGNLLDGSLRWVVIAERDLPAPGDADLGEELERTRRQLETVRRTLEQMNLLVRTSAKSGLSLGTPIFEPGERVSLAEALDHALDVVRPRAASLGTRLGVSIDGRAGPRAAGPMYSVMLNGLHNALDAIEARRAAEAGAGREAGPGEVRATLGWVERGGISRVVLEVIDNGVGVPEADDPGAVFEPMFTTKSGGDGPGGQGIGLAISRQIVLELGGRIELLARVDGPGAVLRAVFPAPAVVEIG